jgi:LacI family transcriptional regulator
MKKISIQQIADELKISKTTVSFVLNGKGDEKHISKKTQEKVFALVKKYNYRPSSVAQSLKTGTTMSVAYLVPDISNPFFAKIGRVIEDLLSKEGYQLLIGSTDENPEKEENLIHTFLNRQVDAIILATCFGTDEKFNNLLPNSFPLVFFDRKTLFNGNYVLVENQEAMQLAVSALLKRGYSRPGLISLPLTVEPLQQRFEGFMNALADEQIKIQEGDIKKVSANNLREETELAIRSLIDSGIDSMVFTNNLVASEALWLLNKHFPEAFAKLGFATFDNLDTFDYMVPKIISVAQPVNEIAESISESILQQLTRKKSENKLTILKPALIIR